MSDPKPKGRTAPPNEGLANPAKIFIQWKSKNKCFSYYSKEKEEDIMLPMPLTFIPLRVCHTAKGYNHKKTKTFIANEVDNTADTLTVTSYNNKTKERKVENKGSWAEIKEDVDNNVKFTESVYAAIKNKKGEMSLVNIQLNGAGLHHWFNFIKKNNIWKGSISVSKTTDEENGDVTYKAPVYEIDKISEADDVKAGELQEVINTYLTAYFAKNATSNTSQSESKSEPEAEKSKSTGKASSKKSTKKEVVEEEEEEIEEAESVDVEEDDDDMPF